MNKMNKICLALVIFVLAAVIASAEEQPVSRIDVCDENGNNCHRAEENEYVKLLACQRVMLKSASYDTLNKNLTAKWFLDGKPAAEGDMFEIGFFAPGYKLVTLNVSNSKFFHNMSINLVAEENKPPILEKVAIEVGSDSDKKKHEFDPLQQQKQADTVINFPVFIWREYINTDDQLTSKITGDIRSAVITDKPCNDDSCETEINFSKEGIYQFTFEDSDTCGQANSTKVEIRVLQNRPLPLGKIDIFGDFAGESSVSLSGKDPEKNDSENEIVEYNWTIIDKNGNVVKNTISKSSEFSFSGEPGAYNATLCVTDRFGGTACSEPHSISILGRETLIADPTATSQNAVVGQNITFNASYSKPLRFIWFFEWRMCYLDKEKCIDEKLLRSYNPAVNTTVPRSGEYDVKLKIYEYDGNKTADSLREFRINVKSAPEEKSISEEESTVGAVSTETPTASAATVNVTVNAARSLETEIPPETPALGILPALLMLYLARFVKKEVKNK